MPHLLLLLSEQMTKIIVQIHRHAQDNEGYTAGEYASGSKHRHIVELILEHAVRAELILGTIARRERTDASQSSRDYLASSVTYKDGQLLDEDGEAVMMGWEAPLMERHAEAICQQASAQKAQGDVHSCTGNAQGVWCPNADGTEVPVGLAMPELQMVPSAGGWSCREPG